MLSRWLPTAPIMIAVHWDFEAAVWVGVCEEIPGLGARSASLWDVQQKLKERLPAVVGSEAQRRRPLRFKSRGAAAPGPFCASG